MANYFDALETRSVEQREAALMAALPVQVGHAQGRSAAFAQILGGVDATRITSRAALAQLPVTRKSELQGLQQASREQAAGGNVFGGFSSEGFGAAMPRVFASPGPIYEPEGTARDYWRMARAIFAAGFRPGELIHNSSPMERAAPSPAAPRALTVMWVSGLSTASAIHSSAPSSPSL